MLDALSNFLYPKTHEAKIAPPPIEITEGQKAEMANLMHIAASRKIIIPFLLLGEGQSVTQLTHMQAEGQSQTTTRTDMNGLTISFDYEGITALANLPNIDRSKIIAMGFAHPDEFHLTEDIVIAALPPQMLDSEGEATLQLMTRYQSTFPNLRHLVSTGTSKGERKAWVYAPEKVGAGVGFTRTGASIKLS